jgi:hypothetical protein
MTSEVETYVYPRVYHLVQAQRDLSIFVVYEVIISIQ